MLRWRIRAGGHFVTSIIRKVYLVRYNPVHIYKACPRNIIRDPEFPKL